MDNPNADSVLGKREPYERHETEAEKLDRNYSEELQELRIAETGVQILFAFLLSIAFQQRFAAATTFQKTVYIITLVLAAISTAQLIAPVAIHRALFRQRRKDELVRVTSVLALSGLSTLLLAMLGAVLLIVDFVVGRAAAIAIDACLAVVFAGYWLALPLRMRRRSDDY
jgi:hypothetical protein